MDDTIDNLYYYYSEIEGLRAVVELSLHRTQYFSSTLFVSYRAYFHNSDFFIARAHTHTQVRTYTVQYKQRVKRRDCACAWCETHNFM